MRNSKIYLLYFILISCSVNFAQKDSIDFLQELNLETTVSPRPLFIYFSGANCPPCRKMERNVFTDQKIIETVNASYSPYKVTDNAERKLFGVESFPTILIYKNEKEIFRRITGYIPKEELLKLLKHEDDSLSMDELSARIASGNASADIYYRYLESKRIAGQNDSIAVSQYFAMLTENELGSDSNKRSLMNHLLYNFQATIEYTHPAFQYFLNHEESYRSVVDSALLTSIRTFALLSQAKKAMNNRDEAGVLEICGKFGDQNGETNLYTNDGRLVGSSFYLNYRLVSLIKWYNLNGDTIKRDSCEKLLFEFCKIHPEYLERLCGNYIGYNDKSHLEAGVEVCKLALKRKKSATIYKTMGEYYQKLHKDRKAKNAHRKAAELSKSESKEI